MKLRPTLVFLPMLFLAGDALAEGSDRAFDQTGEASVYADRFEGRKTASGERFDQDEPTAAHRTLPLGTEAKVTNLETGRSVEVEINDRGPYVEGRVIDLSEEAAERIDVEGLAPVRVEAPPPESAAPGEE